MKLTDEQIASIMTKETSCKTILVNNDEVDATVSEHKSDGWKLVNKSEINGRTKLTFTK